MHLQVREIDRKEPVMQRAEMLQTHLFIFEFDPSQPNQVYDHDNEHKTHT